MPRSSKLEELDAELAALEAMPLAQLRLKWSSLSDAPVPRVSAGLLRLALAWQLQARVHGALPRQLRTRLDQLAAGRTETQAAQPGMKLMREWNGRLHVVTVDEAGVISWNGEQWKSLSAVARAITGTQWSGPAFFGLKRRAGNTGGSDTAIRRSAA